MQAPKGVCSDPRFPLLQGYTQGQLLVGALCGHASEGHTLWTDNAVVLVHHRRLTAPVVDQNVSNLELGK